MASLQKLRLRMNSPRKSKEGTKEPTARCAVLVTGEGSTPEEGGTLEMEQHQLCWLLQGGGFAAGCWDLAERSFGSSTPGIMARQCNDVENLAEHTNSSAACRGTLTARKLCLNLSCT